MNLLSKIKKYIFINFVIQVKHPAERRRIYELYHELEKVYKSYVLPDMIMTKDKKVYDLQFQLLGTGNAESIYIRYYLQKCMKLRGAVCEFGIAQGATSALLAHSIRNTHKDLWLFDSFQGLSVPTDEDILKDDIYNLGSMDKYAFSMRCDISEVKCRLKKIDIDKKRVVIVPGFIEETVKQDVVMNKLQRVCFAYIDFDLYMPILTALEFLHGRIQNGGVIIVDDYDFFSTGVKTAVDEFVKKYADLYILELPVECAGHFCIIQRV